LHLICAADFPHMNTGNRPASPLSLDEPASTEAPVDPREQAFALRQQLWERAQRLYGIGELDQAAQLLSQLAAGPRPRRVEGQWEAARG
jgi:hypothetical protein